MSSLLHSLRAYTQLAMFGHASLERGLVSGFGKSKMGASRELEVKGTIIVLPCEAGSTSISNSDFPYVFREVVFRLV